jgi:GAF domain-containing protein
MQQPEQHAQREQPEHRKQNQQHRQQPHDPADIRRDNTVFIEQAVENARAMLRDGANCSDVLHHLAIAAERLGGADTAVSIMVIDKDGLLRNGASPTWPADYLAAIDRHRPDANVGTCAAAAATGDTVLTPDFLTDDKWAELRHLPSSLGFVGAWSMPIKSPDGAVLGTFGTYFRERRYPTHEERSNVERLVLVAADVLRQADC